MSTQRLKTNQPVRYEKDKKGNLIPIFRGGQLDRNKYAKLTPQEKHNKTQIGKDKYTPPPEDKK